MALKRLTKDPVLVLVVLVVVVNVGPPDRATGVRERHAAPNSAAQAMPIQLIFTRTPIRTRG
jgi:hypothetical protein